MTAARLEAFAAAVDGAGFAGAVLSQPRDVFYLAGTAQPCNLLVVPGRPPTLFARRFADLARVQSHVKDVIEEASLKAVRARLEAYGLHDGRVGMELDVLPANLYRNACETFAGFEVEDISHLLAAQRMVKDEQEIDALRLAAGLFAAVHEAMCEYVRPGVAEHELSAEVARNLRRAGHDGLVFYRRWDAALQPEGAIASGANLWTFSSQAITVTGTGLGLAVPFGASRRVLREGDLVNIDLGLVQDGYHADMARTYAVGQPPPDIVPLADAVRACQDAALAAIRPGVPAAEVYDAALQTARELGVDEWFQGYGRYHGPYIGHGLGLELDEPPVLGPGAATELREGMVLAIEPKLIVPGVGAVNLEDDVVVRAGGPELLSSAVRREVFSVHADGSAEPVRSTSTVG